MAEAERQARKWVRPLMRAGYGGRGVVYMLVGVLTLFSAWQGRDGQATQSALATLREAPLGRFMLVALALGLVAYALWRLINAVLDLDEYGTDAKGVVARLAMVVVGIIHAALAVVCITIAFGITGGDGESGVDSMTRQVFEWPFGRWLVGAAGLATIGGGIYFLHQGWSEDFKRKIVRNEVTQKLSWLMRFGLAAHGLVIALIGVFFVIAAWQFDAGEAGGMQQAFTKISEMSGGAYLLGAVAIGFIGFAVTCFVNAAYRVVPARVSEDDDRTVLTGEPVGEALGR